MKLILFTCFLFLGNMVFSQINPSPQFNNDERTREAIFFIVDLKLYEDAQKLDNYLMSFEGKIVTVNIDLSTQMCVMDVKDIDNINLEELIFQAGFKGIVRPSLPPTGFKYVYNPDGTWKLKEI